MMSLWAEDATFTVDAGRTLTGKEAIRDFWLATPAVPAREPLGVGDAGLQAPRHGERRQGHAVLRVPLRRPGDREGRRASWGRTSRSRGSTGSGSSRTTWERPRSWPLEPVYEPQAPGQPPTSAAKRRLSPADNPLVRAIGRLPAKVHTKLLVAFLATALLVVVVGLLGLRVLGQSNERVETIRELQTRALAYGQLQSDVLHIRLLLAENVAGGLPRRQQPRAPRRRAAAERWRVDRAVASAVARIEPATAADRLGFVPPAADAEFLAPDPREEHRCSRPSWAGSFAPTRPERPSSDQLAAPQRGRAARHRPQSARRRAHQRHDGGGQRAHRRERECLHGLARPVHRGRGRGDRRSR